MVFRPLAVLCFALGLIGCAQTEGPIRLHYRPMASSSVIEGAGKISVLVDIYDARTDYRDRVASKKAGAGEEDAPIKADRDISQVFRDVVEAELKERGFKIGAGGITAHLDLYKFYTDFKIGFWSGNAAADVVFRAQVLSTKQVFFYSKEISASGLVERVSKPDGAHAKAALETGLQTAIANLMNDQEFIAALFKAGAQDAP